MCIPSVFKQIGWLFLLLALAVACTPTANPETPALEQPSQEGLDVPAEAASFLASPVVEEAVEPSATAEPTQPPTAVPTETPVPPTFTPRPTKTPPPPTPTPEPTEPPPTSTPAAPPTVGDTVVGPYWQVQIQDVELSQEFGDYSQNDETFQFIIITAEVTYLGAEGSEGQYSPEAVVLMQVGPSDTGWSKRAILYRGENSSQIMFFDEVSLLNYMDAGESRTETFVFTFPKRFTDFRFYFPETPAIIVDLEALEASSGQGTASADG
jgi:hypothetical protein